MLPLEITPQDVQALRTSDTAFLLLDCREPQEHAVAAIAESLLVPMGELPDRVEELAEHRDRRVVVYCHHGGRSLRVAQWLRQQGFAEAQSMAGGIDQWAIEIDPAIPRY